MLFSTALLFSSFIFSAAAAPTPESSLGKRQGDRQILMTIAPNYLVPLNQANPNTVYGSQYAGDVYWTPGQNNEQTLIVGWDVPYVEGATECYLKFSLPPTGTGFAYAVEGAGVLNIYRIASPVNPATASWNNRPARLAQQGTATIQSGAEPGDAEITGAQIPCASIFNTRFDLEWVAARIGTVRNRVETFQLEPEAHQGWYLEFAIGA